MNGRRLPPPRFTALALLALANAACGSFTPKVGALQGPDAGGNACDESYEEDGGESYGAYVGAAPKQGAQGAPAADAGWDAEDRQDAGSECSSS
jgi:hypothetical protein